jgi:hypothetical protein
MIEQELKDLDLWQSPNGNLFLKMNSQFSIALGNINTFHQIGFHNESEKFSIVKSNPIIPVRKVGKLKINTKDLKED